MLKKTITYENFNGEKVTEDFYFNLTKAELAEMELTASNIDASGEVVGGMEAILNEVVKSGSGKRIVELFKAILSQAYGVKSEDGKRFVKSPELFAQFTQTAAYSDFFMELMTEPDAASNFIKAIMPSDFNEAPKPKNMNNLPPTN